MPSQHLALHQLLTIIETPDGQSNKQSEPFMFLKILPFYQKMRSMLIPMQLPVIQGDLGSAFGWRIDSFTGAAAVCTC